MLQGQLIKIGSVNSVMCVVESSLNVPTHLKIQGKMKHVLGGMSFPELLMRSIHAESTCLIQGHQVRILTYLYKKNVFSVDLF